ncbi:aa3-type cytochrome c oxidase subunit IV [Pseudoruegeria sp. SK021]|nr:aa3-type cytochrome c oxidase subunit IV [Pseudoruegeria sp. SK021]OSP55664.1 hypothetical protein BV911_06005 [Pseudoruegeria sp. SK021]
MSDYEHGKMDIDVQEKTFAGFTKMVTYGTIAVILTLIFLALANG